MAKYLHRMTATSDTLGLTVRAIQVEYTATYDEPAEADWMIGPEVTRHDDGLTYNEARAIAEELMEAIDSGDTEYIEQFWDISWERCIQKEDPRD